MDPVTTAVIAAITAGVTTGGHELVKNTVSDAYERIKSLLKEKFSETKVLNALADLEDTPGSEGRQITLKEEIVAAKADQDPDLIKAARTLLEHIKAQPGGDKIIQNASGKYIVQAADNSKAFLKVNTPKE